MSMVGFWNKLFKRKDEVKIPAGAITAQKVWHVWDGNGLQPVSESESRLIAIRNEIAHKRRNKKKISHLVAELAELESRK